MFNHESFMAEALTLAQRGRGAVEPNPMVGAVIVREGQIVARGWHKKFGGPHAEIEAINEARSAGVELAGTTMYVTLEPCCHFGKTPPCTDALLAARIARVVLAMADPFPKVAGQGIQKLRSAGIEVVTGVLEQEARQMLQAYIKLRTAGRPWVICKWAQTLDGRISTRTGDSKWISSASSRKRVHILRSECDGVLVGIGTILADDPLLTNRSGHGRQPARVVLDERLLIGPGRQVVQSISQAPLLIATTQAGISAKPQQAQALAKCGADLLILPPTEEGVDIQALLDELGRREWTRLLVEGGSGVLGSFVRMKLADELQVFLAACILGGKEGLPCVTWDEVDLMEHAMRLPRPEVEAIDCDLLLRYRLT